MTRPDLSQSPPEPLVLHASRRYWGLVAFGCAVCVAIASLDMGKSLVSVAGILFFGLGVLIALLNLWPGASQLVIDGQGICMRTLFRTWRVAWHDIAKFDVMRLGTHTSVGFDYVPGYPRHQEMRKINVSLSGFEAAIPATYGLSAAALAELLQRWHRHAGASPSTIATDETADAPV